MMRIMIFLLWAIIGSGSAWLYLISQKWSVGLISPRQPNRSQLIIIGGAVFRWIFIFMILLLSLSFSISAMLITFTTFMVTRIFLLLRWNGMLDRKNKPVQQVDGS